MRKLPILLMGASAAAIVAGAATRSPKNDISRNLDIFTAVYKNLQTSYVDSIDADKSINTAIAAMLNEIDPYTEYIPESEQEEFMTISTGEYGGIGSYIGTRDGKTFVSEPREGSPAQRVGLIPGDVFITIDGDSVTSLSSDQISKKLRGQAGTKVNVTVKRPYGSAALSDTTLAFEITREKIDVDPVPYYGVVRGDIGYIQLTTFNEKSFQAVKDALTDLKKDPAVKSIVLDLRNNGGGLLESAVQIVGLFVPKGTEVVRTRGKGLVNEKIYKTTHKPVDTETPLAILALERRRGGMSIFNAAVAGAEARLRPILMTSLALIIGLLPMMFASGVGANGNRALGVGSVGGMLIGMILQIFIVPAMFVAFQFLQEKFTPMKWEDTNNAGIESEIEQYSR